MTPTKSTREKEPTTSSNQPGSEMVEALQQYVAPTMGQRLMDHKVGVGGTLAGGTIAVGCALAEPCGAGVVIAGVVITTGAAIYDMATH